MEDVKAKQERRDDDGNDDAAAIMQVDEPVAAKAAIEGLAIAAPLPAKQEEEQKAARMEDAPKLKDPTDSAGPQAQAEGPPLNARLEALRARLQAEVQRRGPREARAPNADVPQPVPAERRRYSREEIDLLRRMHEDETVPYPSDPSLAAQIFNALTTHSNDAVANYAREKKELIRLRKTHAVVEVSQQLWLRNAPYQVAMSGMPMVLYPDGRLYLNPTRFTRYNDRYRRLQQQVEREGQPVQQAQAGPSVVREAGPAQAIPASSGTKRARNEDSGRPANSSDPPISFITKPPSPNKRARTAPVAAGDTNLFLDSGDMIVRARNNDTSPTYVRFGSHARVDRLIQLQAALGNPGSLEATLDRLTMLGAEDKASLPDYHFWCRAILRILAYGGRGEQEADRAAAFAAGLQELEQADEGTPQKKKLDELQEELSTLAGAGAGDDGLGSENDVERRRERSLAPSVSTVAAEENSRGLSGRGRRVAVRFRSEESVIPPAPVVEQPGFITPQIATAPRGHREDTATDVTASEGRKEEAKEDARSAESKRTESQATQEANTARRAVDMEVDERKPKQQAASADKPGTATNAIYTPGKGKTAAAQTPASSATASQQSTPKAATPPTEPKPKIPADMLNDLICVFVNQVPLSVTQEQFLEWIRSIDTARPAAVAQLSQTVDKTGQYTRVYFWTTEEAQSFISAMRSGPQVGDIVPGRLAMIIMKQKQKRPNVAWTDCFDDDAVQKLVHLGKKAGKVGMPEKSPLTGKSTASVLPFKNRLGGMPARPGQAAASAPTPTATKSTVAAQPTLPVRPSATIGNVSPASAATNAGSSLASRLADGNNSTAAAQQATVPAQRQRNASGSSSSPSSTVSNAGSSVQSALLTRLGPASVAASAVSGSTSPADGSRTPPTTNRNAGGSGGMNRQTAALLDRFDGTAEQDRRAPDGGNGNGRRRNDQDEQKDGSGSGGLLSRLGK